MEQVVIDAPSLETFCIGLELSFLLYDVSLVRIWDCEKRSFLPEMQPFKALYSSSHSYTTRYKNQCM